MVDEGQYAQNFATIIHDTVIVLNTDIFRNVSSTQLLRHDLDLPIQCVSVNCAAIWDHLSTSMLTRIHLFEKLTMTKL